MIASDQQTLFRASYTAVRRALLIKGSVYSIVVEYWVKKNIYISYKTQKHIKRPMQTQRKSRRQPGISQCAFYFHVRFVRILKCGLP